LGYRKLYIALITSCFILAGQKSVNAQELVDSLIEKRQYLSAFEYLSQQPDTVVDAVLTKTELAMNYYWHSYKHRKFSFIDLRKGESIEQLRVQEPYGDTPFSFVIDSVLLDLEQLYPDDFRIKKALGDYYNQVYYDFGDSWGERSEVLLNKSNDYYLQAYEQGLFDDKTLYALGYYQSLHQNYFEAQNWFLKSLQANANNALTNYSLAVTYLFDGLPRKGIPYGEKAYELYVDSLKKSDAARIAGILYLKNIQNQEAYEYFIKADELHSNYRPNQLYLLKAAVLLNKDSVAIETGCAILNDSPYSPDLPNELNGLFLDEKKTEWLHTVYDRVLESQNQNNEALGNIRFHYGKLLFKEGKKRKAKRMIKQSKKDFSLVFDESHQVFEAIEQTLKYF
jgi:hypothetical protein